MYTKVYRLARVGVAQLTILLDLYREKQPNYPLHDTLVGPASVLCDFLLFSLGDRERSPEELSACSAPVTGGEGGVK